MKDYYKILQIEKTADIVEIRKAYRSLALELHPDVNKSPTANKDFIELNEAYQVLKDFWRRKHYDQLYSDYITHSTTIPPKKEDKWEEAVRRHAEKGQHKAEKFSHDSEEKFIRRTKWYHGLDNWFGLLELIFRAIAVIIQLLTGGA